MKRRTGHVLAATAAVLLLSGKGIAGAADLRTLTPARPAAEATTPPRTVTSPATAQPAALITVTGVRHSAARVTAGGVPVTVTFTGSNLHLVTAVQVLSGAAASRNFTVRLDRGTIGSRRATVTADATAAPGAYTLRLLAGTRLVALPASLAGLTVAAAAPTGAPPVSGISRDDLLSQQMKLQAAEPSSGAGRTGVEASVEGMSDPSEGSLMYQEMMTIQKAAQDDRQAQRGLRDTMQQQKVASKDREIQSKGERMQAGSGAAASPATTGPTAVSPGQPMGTVGSTVVNACIGDLHPDIRATYDELSRVCNSSAPSYQAYDPLRDRMQGLLFEWFTDRSCHLAAIPEWMKEEVRQINQSRLADLTASCLNNCLNTTEALVNDNRFQDAESQCRSCCDYLPEADNVKCQIQCRSTSKEEEIAEQMIDEAREGVENAKEQWKKALQILREVAERQTQNTRALTD